jgi:glycosyltransferase involved in cell wall biosynthesis
VNIYYFHPLDLSFTSAQTIQVLKDYQHLSQLGHAVFLYGTYQDAQRWREIQQAIDGSSLQVFGLAHSKWNRARLKIRFLAQMMRDTSAKLVVTRTLGKIRELTRYKRLLRPCKLLFEMHEEAFPYLLGKKISKQGFQRSIAMADMVLFTGPAQVDLFQQEFNELPRQHLILPNGVELDRFSHARRDVNGPLSYLGQFNHWKNVQLMFQALRLLPNTVRLRIAGGKNDTASRLYIDQLTEQYNVQGRIDYLGFVPNAEVVEKALDGSSALLLPLGENLQSRYLTSPMKLFEYMATPIPVVAVDFPSIRRLADEQVLYLAAPTAEDFAQAIERAIGDPLAATKLNAMNRLAQSYSHETRARRYDEALRWIFSISKVGEIP